MKDEPTLDGMDPMDWLQAGKVEVCQQCIADRPPVDWSTELAQLEERFTLHASLLKAELPDTDPAPADTRWPTLVAIGLGDALDSLERVTTWAQQGKHQGKKWSGQDQQHQIGKMLGHLARGLKGELTDEDTGEHPYAHVAARALMLLGLALQSDQATG